MEKQKLEKDIRDWVMNLGFYTKDGSSPPLDFFAELVATPNRRQLWELLLDKVKSRSKIHNMRKQLLVFHLKEGKRKANFSKKQLNGRIELWEKQNELELEINKSKKSNAELEKNIYSTASDMLFDIFKLTELEKRCEEYKEKLLGLKLFNKKEKGFIKELEKILMDISTIQRETSEFPKSKLPLRNELDLLDQFLDSEICFAYNNNEHNCKVQSKIKEMKDSGMTEENLCEYLIQHKNELLRKLSDCIEDITRFEKNILHKKDDSKEFLESSLTSIKQEITHKSLQAMINEVEVRLLNRKFDTLIERVETLVYNDKVERSLNENVSYLNQEDIDKSFSLKNETISRIKTHVSYQGAKVYSQYLKKELSNLENKLSKKEMTENSANEEKNLMETLNAIKNIFEDLNDLKIKLEEQKFEIIRLQQSSKKFLKDAEETSNNKDFIKEVENIIDKLKTNAQKQVELFLELPLDAIKPMENSSEDKSSACESLTYHLNYSGGELKNFFVNMLISPFGNVQLIIEEVMKRKEIMDEIKNFITEREKLFNSQTGLLSRISAINYDSDFCCKNFKDSDEMLSNALFKFDSATNEFEFAQKILKNWLEQPYRHMIMDSEKVNGKTLREYQELYEKKKKKPAQ